MNIINAEDVSIMPVDTLGHLFQYLDDLEDLKTVSLVCKQWLRATQTPKILRKFKLCFRFVGVGSAYQKPLSVFLNSERTFSNIYFENVKFSTIDEQFWSCWSETITEITFNYESKTDDLPGLNFLRLLLHTPKLKTLNLVFSLHLCNNFMEELSEEERKKLFKNLKNVQELQLYFSEVCIDTLDFQPWLDEMSNLKNIDFDLYCKKAPIPLEAYEKIFYFLNRYGSKIKRLRICDNDRPLNKSVIQRLLAVDGLELKALDLIINNATSKLLTDFLCTQSELQDLTVNGSFSLNKTFAAMPKLKEIALANGPALDGFEVFNNVPKLVSLGIAGLDFYNEDNLDETYKLQKNLKLEDLYLIDASVNLELPLVRRLCECFPNIRVLDLDAAMIDDEGFQYIFQLKKLMQLRISNTQISNHGIFGTKNRGKKRKHSQDSDPSEEYSINSLKDLEVLNIDFCKKITEKSYLMLELKKLKHLSAQGALLTPKIFESLGKKCPNIVSMDFSKCNSLHEKETEALAKNISKLETLELKACTNFNDPCLKILMENCKKLQTLDISKTNCDVKMLADEMFLKVEPLGLIIVEKEKLYRCNYAPLIIPH